MSKAKSKKAKGCLNTKGNCHNLIIGRTSKRFCSNACAHQYRSLLEREPVCCFLCTGPHYPHLPNSWYCEQCRPFVAAKSSAARKIARHRRGGERLETIRIVLWELYQLKDRDVCEICGRTFDEGPRSKYSKHIDHSHKTGRIRGVLCGSCNPMLGYAHDNWAILSMAISYLERNQKADWYYQRSEAAVPISGGGSGGL